MRQHHLTRSELLLVIAAALMISAVAVGAGRRQAVQPTAGVSATLPATPAATTVDGVAVPGAGVSPDTAVYLSDCPLLKAGPRGAPGTAAADVAAAERPDAPAEPSSVRKQARSNPRVTFHRSTASNEVLEQFVRKDVGGKR